MSSVRTMVRVVIDTDDDPLWSQAALAAHHRAAGRITLHPTPGASTPPALAQDLLHALDKRLPPYAPGTPRHQATWADQVTPAWTAAACWIGAHRIGHLIVLRTLILSPTRWKQLAFLHRQTQIHLTLLWHQANNPTLHQRAALLGPGYGVIAARAEEARRVLGRKGRARPDTAPCTVPSAMTCSREQQAIEEIQRIGHPLHAGLIATQTITGTTTPARLAAVRLKDLAPDVTAIALPHPPYHPTSHRTWHPVPAWARPAITAARAWHYLTGHAHPSRCLFQHLNFHHHNQLTMTAPRGITPAIDTLTGNPAWPTPTPTSVTSMNTGT
ncbi:hypothetical protein ACFW9D_22620 [Streptomyces sp. NPDC059524]|uniref:hypothetical protein n=1 Tax=Streptomyces sp. NPDC059524 TaxID=3346856 RepID=UPI0036837481